MNPPAPAAAATRALALSTIAFTICFAVWTIFSIVGLRVKEELGLTETQFGLLIGMPVLSGSLIRLLLGIWTDRLGGRVVFTATMVAAAAFTALLPFAQTYAQFLLVGLGVGLAGGSFAVGVAYVSRFYPPERQGTALGIFGVGNVGAAVTKFGAPFLLVPFGWEAVAWTWSAALLVTAVAFWLTSEDDPLRAAGTQPRRSFWAEFAPLRDVRVWRHSLTYFFVFGAFVALALWLPRYLVGVYDFDLRVAGLVGAAYSIPGSIFRALGGVLSDRVGARRVLWWVLGASAACCLALSAPASGLAADGTAQAALPLPLFIAALFTLGLFMALGKAAVYKEIPADFPRNVGAVGGLVGMIGGLGGFVLPIAFGALRDATGLWSSCFGLLLALVLACAAWMALSARTAPRGAVPAE